MKLIIKLLDPAQGGPVLNILAKYLMHNQGIQEAVLAHGMRFESLHPKEAQTFRQRLQQRGYTYYEAWETGVTLKAGPKGVQALLQALHAMLHPGFNPIHGNNNPHLAWSGNLVLQKLPDPVVYDLKKALTATEAQVTVVDTRTFRLYGWVISQTDSALMEGVMVEVQFWAKGQQWSQRTAVTDGQGKFFIEWEASWFQDLSKNYPVELVFKLSREGQSLKASSSISKLEWRDQKVELVVHETVQEDPPIGGPSFTVSGNIYQADGRPLAGVMVRAFDRDMRSEEFLGEQTTEGDGFYMILYYASQFKRAEKGSADLLIRVYDANGRELAASDILFNAPPEAVIDLTVPASAYHIPSEWERLHAEIAPLREAVAVHELTDDDLDFLSKEAGIHLEQLSFLRQDALWASVHGVNQGVFYGLLRQGMPMVLRALLAERPGRKREALEAALDDNQIPGTLREQLDEVLSQLRDLAVQLALTDENAEGTPLGAILATSGLTTEVQENFVRFTLDYQGEAPLWEVLAEQEGWDQATLGDLRFTLESSALLGHHLPALQMVQSLRQNQNWNTARDIANYDREQWQAVLGNISTADWPVGLESLEDWADAIATRVEQVYPTAVIASRLAAGTDLSSPDLNYFFDANPDFSLLHTPVESFLSNGAQIGQVADIEGLTGHLKTLQRLARITPDRMRYELMEGLWQQGYTSAISIANADRDTFIGQMTPISGETAAAEMYEVAQLRSDIAQMTLLNAGDLIRPNPRTIPGFGPIQIPGLNPNDPNPVPPGSELPEWVQLFGSLSTCDCRHCRSVYSPASYLVDLLQFLRQAPRTIGNHNLLADGLRPRRPDIEHLLLNCENANTPLPYIDLVNEVLERAVAGLEGEPYPQTEGEAERLRAMPAHELPEAYEILEEASFPWLLPFDLHHERTRLWAGQLQIDLGDLYSLFGRTVAEAARMELWLAPRQWELISTPETETANLLTAWGIVDGVWREEVPLILQRANMSYTDLEDLLRTGLLEEFGLESDKSADPCRIELHRLPQPPDEALDLMHRMVRLQRALGWSPKELDEILRLLEVTTLDQDTLIALADTLGLARKIGTKPVEAAVLCASTAEELPNRLSERLEVPIREVLLFLRWLNIDWPNAGPETSNRPAALLRLFSRWEVWRAANADAFELNYLLRHEDLVPAAFEPLTAEMERSLRNLYRAAQEFGNSSDTTSDLEELILMHLAEALGSSPAIIGLLLRPVTDDSGAVITPSMLRTDAGGEAISGWLSFATAEALSDDLILRAQSWWLRLDKAVRIITGLELGVAELAAIRDCGNDFWDFNGLPIAAGEPPMSYDAWERFARAKQFGTLLPGTEAGLFHFLALARRGMADRSGLLAELSAAAGWDIHPVSGEETSLVAPLAEALWPGDDLSTFYQVESFEDLRQAVQLARQHGISAGTLINWGTTDLRTAGGSILETLQTASRQAHANDQSWYQAITPAMDRLRERKRDALVDYLIANPLSLSPEEGPAWTNAEELYAYFLIDVEMNACQLSSRIVQATNAIQLFVQRLRMSLESDTLRLRENDGNYWKPFEEWMKNYRVWEANRKVFLYPENWIEPDLRDNKSPFFEDLESELLQGEVTAQNVEQAYRNYFTKLSDVARLDIRGLYEEDLPGDRGKVLHVFARTFSEPHMYYYRKRLPNRVWTAWEPVEAGISGNHLIPVVVNSQMMLFWVTFQEEINTDNTGAISGRIWKMQMQWSLHRNGHWEAPKSENTPFSANIEVPYAQLADFDKNVSFRVLNIDDDNLDIGLFFDIAWVSGRMGARNTASETIKRFVSLASFSLDACKQELVFKPASPYIYHLPAYLGQLSMEVSHQGYTRGNYSDSPVFQLSIGYRGVEPIVMEAVAEAWDGRHLPAGEIMRLNGSRGFPRLGWSRENVILEAFSQQPSSRVHLQPSAQDVVLQHLSRPFFLSHHDEGRYYLVSPHTGLIVEERPTASGFRRDINNPYGWFQDIVLPGNFQYDVRIEHHYQFETFYHPFLCTMLERFNNEGLDGLLKADRLDTMLHRQLHREGQRYYEDTGAPRSDSRFATRFEQYRPTGLVWQNFNDPYNQYPYEQFEFAQGGAYSLYNWELFFHIPLLVADRLSKNQRFEEARRWFHYIFDPTDFSAHDTPAKYWQIKPLFELAQQWGEESPPETLEEMLRRLSSGNAELQEQVRAWREDPFNPHLLARMRLIAYMKTVVQKYLDNLIAWGDQLFRQDTMESINEARQLYVLAAQILGPRPVQVTQPEREPLTYAQAADRWDAFSNVLIEMETGLPPTTRPGAVRARSPHLSLYFCIPFNDRLLGYWNTVEDRLFKIRNCLNLKGQARQLALFAPPIDPALLVRARAAGLDLGEVLSGLLAASLPAYRYALLAQKAVAFCGEVRSLGSALLSALEKKDADALALMRSSHETALMQQLTEIKDWQIRVADETLSGLQAARRLVEEKQEYFSSREYMNAYERSEGYLLKEGKTFSWIAKLFDLSASLLAIIPENKAGAPTTAGSSWGGKQLSAALKFYSSVFKVEASAYSFEASQSALYGRYERRRDDWDFQARLAEMELEKIDRQILTAEIRRDIAIKDKANHLDRIRQAEETDRFMRSKFTNSRLYSWMSAQLSALHYQAYKMAFDLAQKAEQTARFELGLCDGEFSFIQFGHWDSQKKGLLAGDRLLQDLRRLETAYLERNHREYELTKQISLLQLDPIALIQLKETGTCTFALPEALFDLDHPGHYLRRIKSVSISIPCETGPHTGINARLTQLTNRIRFDAGVGSGYAEREDDPRFRISYAATQTIATSNAQNDSGLFEMNFRDERFLPFEGSGAISEWRLELSGKWGDVDLAQFDFDTISDVVMHLRYTAQDGFDILKNAAVDNLQAGLNSLVEAGGEEGLFRLFSLRHEFVDAWQQFQQAESGPLRIELSRERFPFFARARVRVQAFELFLPGEATGQPLDGIELTGWPIILEIPGDNLRGQQNGLLVCRYRV